MAQEPTDETVPFSQVRQVDLSKAYVISNVPCLNDAGQVIENLAPPCKTQLRLGGIISYSQDLSLVNWIQLKFVATPPAHFEVITSSGGLQTSERELFKQRMRDTHWSGTYIIGGEKTYLTEFQLEDIQNNFVGGKITHRFADDTAFAFLETKVTGYLVTQYCLLDEKESCTLGWTYLEEGKSLPNNAISRQALRIKRSRALKQKNILAKWGSHTEYRLALEINPLTGKEELIGNVGTTPESYGSDNTFIANGILRLEEKPVFPPLPPPADETVPFSQVRQVDLSKAYVISNAPCWDDAGQVIEDIVPPCQTQLRLGGVISHSQDLSLVNWIQLKFVATPRAHFEVITNSGGLQTSERELFEQRMRDTHWIGTYITGRKNIYLTEFQVEVIQNNFVGGEIIHKFADDTAFLETKVTGYLVTQYCLLDEKGSCTLGWIDLEEGNSLPNNVISRQALRIKRSRALKHKNSLAKWGSHTEYRLALEINPLTGKEELIGNVGTTPESYGSDNTFTASGILRLEENPRLPLPPVSVGLE
jgi:hypothetical protein